MNAAGMHKIVVYTCITGGYDELSPPANVDPLISYFCFTDQQEIVVSPWTFIDISNIDLDQKDKNRYIKMHPHLVLPDHDISIYLDGSIKIVGNIRELALTITNRTESILLYDHPERDCTYDEAAACAHFAHDWIWRISLQMNRYRRRGFPPNSGLFEAGVMIRRNTAAVGQLMDDWWREYCVGAKRDQLSLPYVSWITGVALGSLGISDPRTNNRYLRFVNHRRKLRLKPIVIKYINRAIARLLPSRLLFGKDIPTGSR